MLHGLSRVSPPGYRYPSGFTLNSFKIKNIILSEHASPAGFLFNGFRGEYVILYVPKEGRGQLGESIIIELQIGVYIDNGV